MEYPVKMILAFNLKALVYAKLKKRIKVTAKPRPL